MRSPRGSLAGKHLEQRDLVIEISRGKPADDLMISTTQADANETWERRSRR